MNFYLILVFFLSVYSQNIFSQEKIDLKSLEEQYWSLKDHDFKVVQNRSFSKSNRFYFGFGFGKPINDPYASGNINEISAGYFFNEFYGFEINKEVSNFSNNISTSKFLEDHGTIPNHNKYKGSANLNFLYVPIYAKMSLLDKKVIHFDMSLNIGIGLLEYEIQKNTLNEVQMIQSWNFDISQQYYFHENLALKIDFKNKFSRQNRFRYKINSNESENARMLEPDNINDTSILFSIIYWR